MTAPHVKNCRIWARLLLTLSVLLLAMPMFAAPIVFNASRAALPGDIVSLQGDGFGTAPQVSISALSLPAPQSLPVLSKGTNSLSLQIPGTFPVDVYAVSVTTSAGVSAPVYLNRACAMHYDTPEVAAGGAFRIFGRSLILAGHVSSVRFVSRVSGVSLPATVTGGSAYVLNVSAPFNLAAGETYDIYVTNGGGGSAGETKAALPLLGRTGGLDYWNLQVGWAADYNFYGNVYNVQTDPRLALHAVGDGVHVDGPAIQAAIAAASLATDPGTGIKGGVVYLPAGTYDLGASGLSMASRVVVAGAGANVTTVLYGYAGTSSQPYGTYWGPSVSVAGISDLSLVNVNQSGTFLYNCTNKAGTSELFMQRIRWDLSGGACIYWTNLPKMVIENSAFKIGAGVQTSTGFSRYGPLSLDGASSFIVRGNTVNYAVGGYGMNNAVHDGVIENNHFTRDVSSEYPVNGTPTPISGRQLAINFASNLAIINNTFDITGGAILQNNDGETILTEGGGSVRPDEYVGSVTAATATTLTDSAKTWAALGISAFTSNAVVAVISGPGAGQWRSVTGTATGTTDTLTIDRPWAIVPTSASHYATFDWSASNWLIMNNTITNNERGIALYSASCRNVAIVGNLLTNSGAILVRADQRLLASSTSTIRQTLLNSIQVTGNTVTTTNSAHAASIIFLYAQVSADQTEGTGFECVEARGNTLNAQYPNIKGEQGLYDGYYAGTSYSYNKTHTFTDGQVPALRNVIFQYNTARNCANAFQLSTGAYQPMLFDTSLINCASLLSDTSATTAAHGATGTVIGSAPQVTASSSVSQITLSWPAIAGASGYHVYRATTAGGPYVSPIATVTGTTYTDSAASVGTAYYYTVRAFYPGAPSLEGLPSVEVSSALIVPVSGVALSAGTVIGGASLSGTVTLSHAAPPGGTVVALSSDNSAASVAPTVTVPGGASSAVFSVNTSSVVAAAAVTITVSSGGTSAAAGLTVNPLNAPTNLPAVSGDSQAVLTWNASPGAVSYNLYRGLSPSGEGTSPYRTGLTALTFTDSVINNTAYYYQVTAVAPNTESPRSNEAQVTPQPPVPAAPASLAASAGSAQVTLSWPASAGAVSYSLHRSAASGGPYTRITSQIGSAPYTDTGLSDGTAYYYVVTAVNTGGESAYSPEASATPVTTTANVSLSPATVIGGASLSGTVTLSHAAPAAGTLVSLSSDNSAASVPTSVTVPAGASTAVFSITTTSVASVTTATIAASAGGVSVSAVLTVNLLAAPAALTATAGNSAVSLAWSVSPGAVSYNLYRGLTPGGEGSTPYQTGLTSTSFTDTVTNDTAYYYQVTAVAPNTESPRSNEAQATPEPPAPASPGNPAATAGDGQITITWDTSAGAVSYSLYRGTSAGGPYVLVASAIPAAPYTDTGLANGTTYFFVVTATNTGGESAYSAEASAAPQSPPPAPPTGLTAAPGDTQIVLAWTAGAGDATFNVQRSVSAGGPYTSVASGLTSSTYTDTGLSDGTTYYYVVTGESALVMPGARRSGARRANSTPFTQSAPSNEANATPAAPAVTISGTVSLQGPLAQNQNQPLTFKLRPATGTSGAEIDQTITPNTDGTFSLTGIPAGTYTLAVKGSKWLQSVVPVDTTTGAVSGLSISLLGGDVDGDNAVTALDIGIISAAYRSRPGSSKWNPNADITCEGVVDISDYGIASANYGTHGSD